MRQVWVDRHQEVVSSSMLTGLRDKARAHDALYAAWEQMSVAQSQHLSAQAKYHKLGDMASALYHGGWLDCFSLLANAIAKVTLERTYDAEGDTQQVATARDRTDRTHDDLPF